MKKNAQPQDATQAQPAQGFLSDIRAYVSSDGEYLTLVLPGNMRVRKHRNFYLALLGVAFVPKAAQRAAADAAHS